MKPIVIYLLNYMKTFYYYNNKLINNKKIIHKIHLITTIIDNSINKKKILITDINLITITKNLLTIDKIMKIKTTFFRRITEEIRCNHTNNIKNTHKKEIKSTNINEKEITNSIFMCRKFKK